MLGIFIGMFLQSLVMKSLLNDEDAEIVNGLPDSSDWQVDCKALKAELSHYYKEKDVRSLRAKYQFYLDNCFENDEAGRKRLKGYFEDFLNSFPTNEELEIEILTRENTQVNKTTKEKKPVKAEADVIYVLGLPIKLEFFTNPINILQFFSSARPLPPKIISKLGLKKKVKINPEPEIKFIESTRRRRKEKEKEFDIEISL